MIDYETFKSVELKTGIIKSAEKVEGSDKLLKLKVDLGDEERILMAGLGKQYKPEDLIDKVVIVVANLKPKKIFGIESQGMLLAVEDENGISLLTTDRKVKGGLRAW